MMDKIAINGGKPLSGEIAISGMKNAAVAMIKALGVMAVLVLFIFSRFCSSYNTSSYY